MAYADVSVNSPAARRRFFSYAIPESLNVREGQAVLVPFGEKVLQGIVMALSAVPAVEDTREIIDIIDPEPLLTPQQLSLARWISEYYLSPLFDAVALMLPPGFERNALTFLTAARAELDPASLSNDQFKVWETVTSTDRVALKALEKTLGKKKASAAVNAMVKQGIIKRRYELAPVRVRPKRELYIRLTGDISQAAALPARQASLFRLLIERKTPVAWSEARPAAGAKKSDSDALVRRGLVVYETTEVRREPIDYASIMTSYPLTFTADQQRAFDAVRSALLTASGGGSPSVFLLHGVTGSGKTEVYLQSLAEAVKQGKKGIVLVPEIALTPQTIERFAARFPRRVAVLHSRLSLGEQYDEWRRIRRGECDVVIGSRSAVFAPQPDLGLIIIDEEHEWTYKQDNSPHYHARAVALKIAEMSRTVVLLGSATPDIESYYKARNGEYNLLTLPERVVPVAGAPLPRVEIVDMRDELKAGNRGMFSRSLTQAINGAVAAGEQVILFLNRRGAATFIQCRTCGFVLRCRRCDTPLSQHIASDRLVCHQCGYHAPVPFACPDCGGKQLKFLGAGTQKLEQEVRYTFPRARHLRWDSDVITGRTSHEAVLQKFRNREADILIGTQMIAKGLDIPSVTLVGVVNADTSLNLPDFRSGERTFQLLSQVSGRAGRGSAGGRVIIQTFSPDNYAIQAAARHDYLAFYEQEIAYRRQLHNPPFTQLARLTLIHTNNGICQREAEKLKDRLLSEINTRGIGGMDIIGPAPAFISRLRGRFRWQLTLRGTDLSRFLEPLALPPGCILDIDPMSLVQ